MSMCTLEQETLVRFLIRRFGKFSKLKIAKLKLTNIENCMSAYGAKNSDHQI